MLKRVDWFQKLALLVVTGIFHLYYKLSIKFEGQFPEGGCIVCANHTSNIDPVLLAIAMRKGNGMLSIMAKKELFEKFWLRLLLQSLGAFPIDRGRPDVTAIKTTYKCLDDGDMFLIFPEGTRVKEGQDSDAKAGAGMFALRTKKPVIPVYISTNKKFRGRVSVIVGQAYNLVANGKKGTEANIEASEDILNRINILGE